MTDPSRPEETGAVIRSLSQSCLSSPAPGPMYFFPCLRSTCDWQRLDTLWPLLGMTKQPHHDALPTMVTSLSRRRASSPGKLPVWCVTLLIFDSQNSSLDASTRRADNVYTTSRSPVRECVVPDASERPRFLSGRALQTLFWTIFLK